MNEEEIRIDQTKKVFKAINSIINNGSCSYRYLIYDLLGFNTQDYEELIDGMNIINHFVDYEELQQKNKQLETNWKELKKYIDKNKLVLNNPQILDFYLKMQELESGNNECN